MDLKEAFAEYEKLYPPVDINSPPGTRITFHGNGGYPAEKEAAHKVLTVGETYVIADSLVDSWFTTFWLEGFEGKPFNSVLFSPEGWKPPEGVDG